MVPALGSRRLAVTRRPRPPGVSGFGRGRQDGSEGGEEPSDCVGCIQSKVWVVPRKTGWCANLSIER